MQGVKMRQHFRKIDKNDVNRRIFPCSASGAGKHFRNEQVNKNDENQGILSCSASENGKHFGQMNKKR